MSENCTGLSNLIGNRYIHNVEIWGCFCHSDFAWNQFWSFWSPRDYNCVLTIWAALNCEFLGTLTFSSVKFFQISKFKAFKVVKTAVLNHQNLPELISRKIRVVSRKIAKFPHCGISTVKNPNQTVQVCTLNKNCIFSQIDKISSVQISGSFCHFTWNHFGESSSCKIIFHFLQFLGALNFVDLLNFCLYFKSSKSAKIHKNQNVLKWHILLF